MSDNITKRVGLGTAYGFAKAGGYEGTVAEFTELLGNIAIDLARIENLSVTVTTLPAGSQATASLNGSVLSLGIPKGDKGDKGNTGETGAPAGFGTVSATVDDTIGAPSVEVTASGADTAKNFAFAFHNLKGEKGDKGDTGEVSQAEFDEAVSDLKSDLKGIAEKAPNLYDSSNVILGKNWAGGDAADRAYIQIPVTAGQTYTVVIPQNTNIPRVAVVQLDSNRAPLGSFYITGGNSDTLTTVTNCVNIRIQFEGSVTLNASDFVNYDVQVFEGTFAYISAIDRVARGQLPKNKKYIFIGDSYCEGYSPDGSTTGWGARLKTAMGLTDENCIVKYQGGTGFYHVSNNKTFSTLLDEAGDKIMKSSVTDIVVCGGWNDNSDSLINVYNAVLAVIGKVRDEYPNAKLHIGMIGASNDATVKQRLQNTVLYSYQYGALANIANYLNNVEYALAESNLASDGIHPNADGQVQITIAIKQALETGSAYIPYRFYTQIKTS